jgi:hypothetical protein
MSVAAGEEYAANCVRINDQVLIARGYPALETHLDRLIRRRWTCPNFKDGRRFELLVVKILVTSGVRPDPSELIAANHC